MAAMSRLVAIGRLMNPSEIFIDSPAAAYDAAGAGCSPMRRVLNMDARYV